MSLSLAEIGDLFSKLDSKEVLVLTVLGGTAIVLIVGIIARTIQKSAQSDHRTRLAALLVQRGLPTTEIERILRAAAAKGDEAIVEASDEPEVQLVKILTDNSYDGDDVKIVLDAARENGAIDASTVAMVKTMSENWIEAKEIAEIIRKRRTAIRNSPRDHGLSRSGSVPATGSLFALDLSRDGEISAGEYFEIIREDHHRTVSDQGRRTDPDDDAGSA